MKISYSYEDIGLVPRVRSTVNSRKDPNTSVGINVSRLDFPLVAAPMDTVCNGRMALELNTLGCVGIIHRFQTIDQQVQELKYVLDKLPNVPSHVGVAIGVDGDYRDRLLALVTEYNQNLTNATLWVCFDTANGFSAHMEQALTWFNISGLRDFRKHFVIAGNVASKEGYLFLARLGVNAVRVGIGSGAACTTGLVTGIGQGIASSVMEAAEAKTHIGNPPLIIADGGVKHSGDILKALALGADLVMVGNLLSGFDESPGKTKRVWYKPWKKYKIYRGMASHPVAELNNTLNKNNKQIIAEGVVSRVPYKGKLSPALIALMGGVRSGLSYLNAHSLLRLRTSVLVKDTLVALTPAAYQEKKPAHNKL